MEGLLEEAWGSWGPCSCTAGDDESVDDESVPCYERCRCIRARVGEPRDKCNFSPGLTKVL
jgi:hypothetical protein